MERLTKLIVKDNDGYNYAMSKERQYVIDCNLGATNINIVELTREHEEGYLYKHYYAQGEAVEKLAEYENAEEQGLLVRLPFKFYQQMFYICGRKILKGKARSFIIRKKDLAIYFDFGNKGALDLPMKNLGKTWFLTEAEALQALKERE